ncbi:MAG: hypothetical protein O7C75_06380, partial [Verrucomicrobia bacterium]|nr:hypothetical protein [Verrucomicrobiota bacterium]
YFKQFLVVEVPVLNQLFQKIVPSNATSTNVMKSKARFAIKRGSVVSYVKSRVAGWNAALRACRF